MRKLYVFYDNGCGFCRRCAWWLAQQPQIVRLILRPRQAAMGSPRFGRLLEQAAADEMIAVSDTGEVYRGTNAYLICLWALRRHR